VNNSVVSTIEKLTEMPYRYPIYYPVASFSVKPLKMEYRKMVVRNYLVFYWVNEEKQHVIIARVIYGGRNTDNILV
jgi:Plasmid stabilisation system protein.